MDCSAVLAELEAIHRDVAHLLAEEGNSLEGLPSLADRRHHLVVELGQWLALHADQAGSFDQTSLQALAAGSEEQLGMLRSHLERVRGELVRLQQGRRATDIYNTST